MKKPSQIILQHRKAAGLTQAQLAKAAGVGRTVVWDLEHDKESVRWDTLQKIFGVLNITWQWTSPLLDRERAQTPPASPSSSSQRSSSS